ncbi:phospholipase [Actinocrinis puniceicyclus]|uniref:Phospholipase n=1 Tax=Actinocrinis puniceicyclus TaxID=977794 RepID=A0A8J7WTA9_9ACTN|nr:phospholipase D-like domain-containing protein [Actinocrinis puniceicyclus]MBS2965774.1 phospholipase [Actinocrinis puniceicyclus]
MGVEQWFLSRAERGNSATRLARAWSEGNEVHALVHGAAYFAELVAAIRRLEPADLLLFTDWRGDPDERLDGPGTEVSRMIADAARRGVLVRGLIWRSHLDRFQFSEQENRHLGDEIEQAGGRCLLDMRVRPGGSHHQKLVVLRHPGRPELDVAYVGGIDLCHSRRDDEEHGGDPQRQPMSARYGPNPPWHDIQLAVRGPAVGDLETVFRERWDDPAALTANPVHRLRDRLQHEDTKAAPLPPQQPDPPTRACQTVQVLRTYPNRIRAGYPFAPHGERSVARGYFKALSRARELIYLEDQYLWSRDVAEPFARALADNPALRLIAVLPRFPDQDGRLSLPPNLVGRIEAMRMLAEAGGDRVAVYGVENHAGVPVYVHAKVCIIDDVWACVGSDNLNRRSWTHDSELACAVMDQPDPGSHQARGASEGFASGLRIELAREHLDGPDEEELSKPLAMYDAFARSAARLDAWYAAGCRGPRPPGRLRTYGIPYLSRWTRLWAGALYRVVYDPDGRPAGQRRRREY